MTKLHPRDAAARPTVIIIGGAQRSGTTLAQTLLENSLPRATQLPECQFLFDLFESYGKRVREPHKLVGFFDGVEGYRSFCHDAFWRALERPVHQREAAHVVLKDPNFVKLMPTICELVPEARCFVVCRDPRDIAASFVQIGQRDRERGQDSKYTQRSMGLLSKKINASYLPFLEARSQVPQVAVVAYEKLCREPLATLAQLAAQLDLELPESFSDDTLAGMEWIEPSRRHSNATWVTELEARPPSDMHVGYFQQVLKPNEIRKLEELCRDVMRGFGYQPISPTG